MIHLKFFLFVAIYAIIKAYFEVQIEGAGGWAANLPTWRTKNKWTKITMGDRPLTGYHCGLWAFEIWLLCSAFFVFGLEWHWQYLFLIASVWFLNGGLEDYLWIVFNPNFGPKKFTEKSMTWFGNWIKVGPLRFPAVFFGNWIPGIALYGLYWVFK